MGRCILISQPKSQAGSVICEVIPTHLENRNRELSPALQGEEPHWQSSQLQLWFFQCHFNFFSFYREAQCTRNTLIYDLIYGQAWEQTQTLESGSDSHAVYSKWALCSTSLIPLTATVFAFYIPSWAAFVFYIAFSTLLNNIIKQVLEPPAPFWRT